MRNLIIGSIFGIVAGAVIGAVIIGPQLVENIPGFAERSSMASAPSKPVPQNHKPQPAPRNETLAASVDETPKKLISWRMASAYSSNLPLLGELAKRIEYETWQVSGGQFKIQFHEPGTLISPSQMLEAVRSGTIDAAFSNPADRSNKIPALDLYSSIPFGPSPSEYMAWFYFAGGQKLYQGIYHKQGIHALICGLIAPEASGWFKKPVVSVDDLNGLRMRISGLGAKVMGKLGVETHDLSDGDVFVALESNSIDAAEFSQPVVDLQLGLYQMASHYYFPGWHQPATLFELIINLDTWNALSTTRKSQLQSVCGDNVRHSLAYGEAAQFGALKKLVNLGVNIRTWPTEVLDQLRTAWAKVVEEESRADPDFRKVWRSIKSFREEYGIWRELSAPQ